MQQPADRAQASVAPGGGEGRFAAVSHLVPSPAREEWTDGESRRRDEPFPALVQRLSRQSVSKHFDAYADIAWDSAALRVDPEDPRWELPPDTSPLGGTAWYRAQAPAIRARIGLHLRATFMKTGVLFENLLQRGLLEFALDLPNRSPVFRYAYHEVIEEGQHSLMFQEFVDRSGVDVPAPSRAVRLLTRFVPFLAGLFPELFFVFVLGGEDPIDHAQRTYLSGGRAHPLLARIMQIHITEEARHLCFARRFLRERARQMGWVRRTLLRVGTPIVLAIMARLMLRPSGALIREFAIPADVIAEAYGGGADRAATLAALRKTRELARDLGIATPRWIPLWRAFGLWPGRGYSA